MFILLTLLVSVLWLTACAVVLAICHTAARGDAHGRRPVAVRERRVLRHATVGRDRRTWVS